MADIILVSVCYYKHTPSSSFVMCFPGGLFVFLFIISLTLLLPHPTVYHMEQTEEPTHHVEPPVRASKSPTVEIQNVWASRDDTEPIIHGMAECPVSKTVYIYVCVFYSSLILYINNLNI